MKISLWKIINTILPSKRPSPFKENQLKYSVIRILSHIVAVSQNNVIGANGGMPWHLPDDFRQFKNKTWAMPVIMGRRTFESMGGILQGRINIVVTSNPEWKTEGAFVVHDINAAIEQAKDSDTKEIFIIGGGKIFKETMNLIHRIYLTRVHVTLPGDTFYPEPDSSLWELTETKAHPADDKHAYPFTFETWERKNL